LFSEFLDFRDCHGQEIPPEDTSLFLCGGCVPYSKQPASVPWCWQMFERQNSPQKTAAGAVPAAVVF